MPFNRVPLAVRTQALLFLFAVSVPLAAQERLNRYALLLNDPPLAAVESFGKAGPRAASADARARVAAAQTSLRAALAERNVTVLGSADTVVNAVFVYSPDAAALAALPGVRRVVPMETHKAHMVKALDLIRAQIGWNNVGGADNAGKGVKIAILDSGIDKDHPAFQDASLAMPAGYPRCAGSDCNYASNKIIAVRSYVDLLVLPDQPEFSRPDDLTPRDRVGHGTAVAFVAAGNQVSTPLGQASGVAPKAWVGNYKIIGSPGVNDVTFTDVFIQALDDAVKDGMDIAVYSYGRGALWGPTDRGATCEETANRACDLSADAVENATRAGLTVVVSAGNDGDLGNQPPTLNTINSPATAPSALSVGATTNSQRYVASVRAPAGAPQAITDIAAFLGNGPKPAAAFSTTVKDVRTLENDGKACTPLANGTLNGMLALIDRGNCQIAIKAINAQQAGAVGVILIQSDDSDFIFPPTGLEETGIPLAMIGATPGAALRTFVNANPSAQVTLDPTLRAESQTSNQIAYFSSYGPNIRTSGIKPEVVAPGLPLYMATQSLDPNGVMYNPSGWVTAQGTSFSAPMAAGVAALFKQRFPNATPAQVKSAVVNSASADIDDIIDGNLVSPARVTSMGAGKVNVNDTARTTLVVEPSTFSFGTLTANSTPSPQTLVFRNLGDSAITVRIDNRARDLSNNARVTLSTSAFPLAPGASQQVTATLQGTPNAGGYEGELVVTGGVTTIRVPYLFMRSDNVLFDAFPITNFFFEGIAGEAIPGGAFTRLVLKATDQYGLPVGGLPVRYRATRGGGRIEVALDATDALGIAAVRDGFLGPEIGEQEFVAEVGTAPNLVSVIFPGRARLRPVIRTDGVVDAASGLTGNGLAPGSYISIFGQNLSDVTRAGVTLSLPLSLAGISVSFDIPSRQLSYPGRLHFVSPAQINVQIPWELAGQNSAQMKVSLGDYSSALYTVPLNNVSPNAFEFTDPGTGRRLAAALDANFALVYDANKAKKGQFIQIYCNGLGPVDATPPSGEPSSANPLARTTSAPTVTIGGRPAEVVFSGLAPGIVGLYQINVRVPADAPSGLQPVTIQVGNVTGKATNIPIE